MRRYLPAFVLTLLVVGGAPSAVADDADWPWSEDLDAVAAAPESHRVLLENDWVRVLEVVIRPGEREPGHTHRWPSVMTVVEKARIRYYGADGALRFETPPRQGVPAAELGADWLGPEGLHSVENIDDRTFRALRVELKGATGEGAGVSVGDPVGRRTAWPADHGVDRPGSMSRHPTGAAASGCRA